MARDRVTWLWLAGLVLLAVLWMPLLQSTIAARAWILSLPVSMLSFAIVYLALSNGWSASLMGLSLLLTSASATVIVDRAMARPPSLGESAVVALAWVAPCVVSALLIMRGSSHSHFAWQRAAQAGVFALALCPVSFWLALLAVGVTFGKGL